jgi:phosphatidate cytidylyltransferase
MLKTRVGTALVGLPIVIYMFVWGSIPMQLALVSVVAYACAHELSGFLVARCVNEFHLSDQEELSLFKFLRSFRIGLILFLAMFFVLFLNLPRLTAPVLLVGAMGLMLSVLPLRVTNTAKVHVSTELLFVCCFAVLPWLALGEIIATETNADGGQWVLFLLAIVWCGDTGGYFGGRFWGKTPLAPSISPKKTREGAVAGVLMSVLGASVLNVCLGFKFGSVLNVLLISTALSVVGQLGDLMESVAKRYGRIKDSGFLIPGHGGVLDRVDSILAATPLLWLYFRFVNV